MRSFEGGIGRLRGGSVRGVTCPKIDEELLVSVEWISSLEGPLKRKDDELELRRGKEDQCCDLQSRVDQLQDQINERQFKVDGFKWEVARKQQLIEEAESS